MVKLIVENVVTCFFFWGGDTVYMKTEACKLYTRVFWIFLPNVIKINPYNFELYRFKIGAFFLRQSILTYTDLVKNVAHGSNVHFNVHLSHVVNFFLLWENFRTDPLPGLTRSQTPCCETFLLWVNAASSTVNLSWLCGKFRPRHYLSVFIRLAVVASQNHKITRNSDKIWPYSSSVSSKVIYFGVNRKLTCDFLYALRNSSVLRWHLKRSVSLIWWRWCGRLFHAVCPAWEKLCSPNLVLHLGLA